jgi:hypothetical protein
MPIPRQLIDKAPAHPLPNSPLLSQRNKNCELRRRAGGKVAPLSKRELQDVFEPIKKAYLCICSFRISEVCTLVM